jgi:predicted permease
VVAVLTLGLGFGATIGMFTVMNAMLFRALPVHEPERLVTLTRTASTGEAVSAFSHPSYLRLRESGRALDGLAAYTMAPVTVDGGDGGRRAVMTFVSENYFQVFGVRPALGRFLTPDDGEPGAAPVVVLGWLEWKQRYGGARGVVGRTVRVNGVPATVVGVAPEGFNGAVGIFQMEAWASLPAYRAAVAGEAMLGPNRSWLSLFGRLRTGTSVAQARAMLAASAREASSEPAPRRLNVEPLRAAPAGARTGLATLGALLLATGLLVLGIASTNVAGLLLARALGREKEFAMRAALGATRGRVLRQTLVESVLLWGAGACLGLAAGHVAVRHLPALLPVQRSFPIRLVLDTSVDARVVAFAVLVSLGTGVVFGAIPAIRASRVDLMSLLRDSAGAGRTRSWVHGAALATQVGASVLLLIIAGLLVRSVRHAASVDPGFDPDPVTWASLDLASPGLVGKTGSPRVADLVAALRDDPLVASAAVAAQVPLGGAVVTTSVSTSGASAVPTSVRIASVSDGYFRTLRIPVAAGREFSAADLRPDTPAVALVDRAAAERLWPVGGAVGQQLRVHGALVTVVGVAAGVQTGRMGEAPQPTVYIPFSKAAGEAQILVRTAGPTRDGAGAIRRAAARAFPGVPLSGPAPLREVILSTLPQGALAFLVGGFGMLALCLTSIGLFGAVAFFAIHSAREIGIRAALGAPPSALMHFVLARGMAPAATGLAVGVVLALGLSRMMGALFAGLSPWDPVAFAGGPLLLIAVGAVASAIPAVWAVRRSPARNLGEA